MPKTTGQNALPDYGSPIIGLTQNIVEQIRLDLKETHSEFSNTLDSEEWRKTLPYPLNTLDNYPALRSILRYKTTSRFWLILSAIYGTPFYVFDYKQVLTPEEALVIKNDYPDLINNIDPHLIPGYILDYETYRNFKVNNTKPSIINNIEPELITNVRPPFGKQSNYYYIYIFFKGRIQDYTQAEIGKIRKDIRNIVEYFMPPDREAAEVVNIFP